MAEPSLTLEIRIASSWEILETFDNGGLDAAIVLRHDNRRTDGDVLMEEPFGWMAAPDFTRHAGEPIRLAMQSESCRVRQMAVAALDQAGIAWQEVFIGGGVATVGAAAAAAVSYTHLTLPTTPY